ncbi:MAG: hypothetical protein HYT87_07490 [Nitrospirae bacterium]|nr:hypothetical protein [Nitrospirota bacterium]
MKRLAALAAVVLLPACSGSDAASPFGYSLDGVLRLNHLQAKGTHNSYHIAPSPFLLADLDYSQGPLDVQLGDQGVRQFELDVHRDASTGKFRVYHIPVVDEGVTCYWFTDCLQVMRTWSDAHLGHHPIFTMIEFKDEVDTARITGHYDEFDAEIRSVWPEDRLITPDLVQGSSPDLETAVLTRGWPTLGESRGKAFFMILDDEPHRTYYTDGDRTLKGRAAFMMADERFPYAVVRAIDDPIAQEARIREQVAAGYLVRTRADALDEPRVGDTRRLEAALRSGAHFLSTDYPAPGMIANYSVEIPGGSPSRCNPVSAPPECTSSDIEDPSRLTAR